MCRQQLIWGTSTLGSPLKPSMYSILHSTGVCVKCHSDFSGLKSKTHGICRLESPSQNKTFKSFIGSNFIINNKLCCVLDTFFLSVLHKHRCWFLFTCIATLEQCLTDCTLSYCRSTECWQVQFMSFGPYHSLRLLHLYHIFLHLLL